MIDEAIICLGLNVPTLDLVGTCDAGSIPSISPGGSSLPFQQVPSLLIPTWLQPTRSREGRPVTTLVCEGHRQV